MRPVLLKFGDITLLSYTVFLDIALLAGLWTAYRLARRYRLPHSQVLDAALWAVIAGLVGGRIHFVLAHWDYYAAQPSEAWQFWRGGVSFGGGLLFGLAACWLFSRARGVSLWDLLDPMAPALGLASAIAWVGHLLAGSAYGKPGRGWGTLFLPDIYGYIDYRFATQWAGVAASLCIFALAWWLLHYRPWPGLPFAAYLALTGAGQFALGFMRGDDALVLGGLRIAQWLDLTAAVGGIALAVLLRWRARATVSGSQSSGGEP